ncbi:MAG: flagellar motor switch phosphatase FliY [Lachnospiraceae bacterium]|nr:flagellar motor switch phosphatase FliY [Lachnospiraceae bacterium]MBO5144069.1 flagellar motor switch phosphatase FliY [Lachnospiraceae bacterium]
MDFFSKDEADVIGEISNISIGSSATAMNLMLGQPIKITTPNVSLVHRSDILEDYENSCILVRVQYTQGLFGTNMLVLKNEDARIITDLMMGNDGTGEYSQSEISPLHISAISEAMNQMTASSATAMSKMFNKKIDISPPTVQQIVIENFEFPDDIPDDLFVKINFRLRVGKLIDSTIMQLYPFDLANSIYKLFQRRN